MDFIHIIEFKHQSKYMKFAFRYLYLVHTQTFNCAMQKISYASTLLFLKITLFLWFHKVHMIFTYKHFHILFPFSLISIKQKCWKFLLAWLWIIVLIPIQLLHIFHTSPAILQVKNKSFVDFSVNPHMGQR